jgi:hypothetical protein
MKKELPSKQALEKELSELEVVLSRDGNPEKVTQLCIKGSIHTNVCSCQYVTARKARVEKDWIRTRRQLRKRADFCPYNFNDCTALLRLITVEPVF